MAAIVVEVPCSGSIHRVELRSDGTVAMLDHSEAVVRAFVAFNAEPPECLAVVDKARNEPIRFIFDNVEMTDKVKGLLACDFAAHVLPIFEARYPDDDRPRKAIAVTRAYWRGKATREQVKAAADAALAAGDAADAAEAARAAAWAAEAADAAWAAGDAAWAVYHNAKAQGLDYEAADAAMAAEERWQLKHAFKAINVRS